MYYCELDANYVNNRKKIEKEVKLFSNYKSFKNEIDLEHLIREFDYQFQDDAEDWYDIFDMENATVSCKIEEDENGDSVSSLYLRAWRFESEEEFIERTGESIQTKQEIKERREYERLKEKYGK